MRRIRVMLGFLLMGAIVNVAVAWGYTYTWYSHLTNADDQAVYGRGVYSNTGAYWALTKYEIPGYTILFGHAIVEAKEASVPFLGKHTQSIQSRVPSWSQLAIPPTIEIIIWDFSAGWPWRSLFYNWDSGTNSYSHAWVIRESSDKICLPLAPIWAGFAFNTIIDATILWLIFPGPFALRRAIRRRSGLCVKCAYDLQGTDHRQCPECGTEVRKAKPT